MIRHYVSGGVVALALAAAPQALAQDAPAAAPDGAVAEAQRGPTPPPPPPPGPETADLTVKLKGASGKRVKVGKRLRAVGTVRPFVPGQSVLVKLKAGKRTAQQRRVRVKAVPGRPWGSFSFKSKRIVEPARYGFFAEKNATAAQDGARDSSRRVKVSYPDLDPGDRGSSVKLLNKLLAKRAYYTARGSSYGSATGRAILAFRKVNNMARTMNATPGIFRTLAAGKGGFKLKWPKGGKHIEADLSRQVMVLAKGGRARHIFHISSGAPATPTIRGKFKTYRKDYGTNSLGMVHSVYFIRGYATHGYKSVPTYPASHGCLRNPIPNSKFIYDWIDIGDVFYVYP